MSCLQGGEQYFCIPGNTGSCLISLPPLLKVNGGKGGGGDANREKSAWIGAPHATRVVGNGYGASAWFGHGICAVVCRISGMQLPGFPLATVTRQRVDSL